MKKIAFKGNEDEDQITANLIMIVRNTEFDKFKFLEIMKLVHDNMLAFYKNEEKEYGVDKK